MKTEKRGRQIPPKEKYRVNERITAREVRVIDEEGQMIGVFTSQKALELANEKQLDLIEIAPNASPPTCKMMDYGKWKYENKKKAQVAKKKQTVISIKEIQIRPRTDEHDLDVKMKSARKFLLDGDKVKVNLRYQGREMAHKEIGVKVLNKVIQKLSDLAIPEVAPKMEGRQLFVVMAPDAVKVKEYRAILKQAEKTKIYDAKRLAKAQLAEDNLAQAETAAESKPTETKMAEKE